jgi:formate-dependent nitrite reductase membrane component NrfD
MNYSLLRSWTFWAIVFNFVFTGYSAISGQIPAQYTIVIDGVLSMIASYFHLQTGKSVTGTN